MSKPWHAMGKDAVSKDAMNKAAMTKDAMSKDGMKLQQAFGLLVIVFAVAMYFQYDTLIIRVGVRVLSKWPIQLVKGDERCVFNPWSALPH